MRIDWKWFLVVGIIVWLGFRLWPSADPSYPPTYEIQHFPLIAQPDNVTCGPTSAAMVLNYYGVKATVDDVVAVAKTRWYKKKGGTEIGGTTPEYVKIAFDKFGVRSLIERGATLDKLKWYVSQGRPAVVLVRSGPNMWHYIVIIGYDNDNVITADPGGGERIVLSNATFMGAWKFTHDLDGKDTSIPCPCCHGAGSWCCWLGPLGLCDMCGGLGKLPDAMWFMMEMGEAQGRTIIVPLVPK